MMAFVGGIIGGVLGVKLVNWSVDAMGLKAATRMWIAIWTTALVAAWVLHV